MTNTMAIPVTVATAISVIPLIIYIAFKTPEDDGAWLGKFGVMIIGLLRRLKNEK